ncbi:MAG: hypothetical protein K2Y51_18755 [Gammaproteobacteria bacterium]|nr:hypothetical protein [Gammaproteobacteria bacterium]
MPLLILCLLFLIGGQVTAGEAGYVFGWSFIDPGAMAPRGGTTAGKTVQLQAGSSPAWQALRETGLSDFERDRRAILAMAGEYRTSFDFLEVAGFTDGYTPPRPYRSWGTEKVYVVADRGEFISLQHVLVMRIATKDGGESEAIVTKHWRQDWQYEPTTVLRYRGRNRWQAEKVPDAERRGAWAQTVWQVDDSPRYGDVARWQHYGNYSAWASADGWRPLPRREFSTRSDYDLLVGSNRHVILPNGWLHEQNNNKVRLDPHDGLAEGAVVAREIGLNRYERIAGFDFAAGDRYVERTTALWSAVSARWAELAASGEVLKLKGAPDKDQLFVPLFEYAQTLANGAVKPTPAEITARVRELTDAYLTSPAPGR